MNLPEDRILQWGDFGLEDEEEIRGVLFLILPVDWIQKNDGDTE